MKRPALFFLLILMITIILPACHENEWADWRLKNEQWMATNKSKTDILTTASGLQYKVIHQGYQRKPSINSYVKVNYKGTLIDGSTFDSGTGVVFSLSSLVPGWQEGITKMNGGGTYVLYVPSKLGYDTLSTNVKIPPYSTLIFEVDLVDSQN